MVAYILFGGLHSSMLKAMVRCVQLDKLDKVFGFRVKESLTDGIVYGASLLSGINSGEDVFFTIKVRQWCSLFVVSGEPSFERFYIVVCATF